MADIIDLSDLIGPPRKVKIGESLTLLMPFDLPVELYLQILHLQDRPDELEDQAVVESLRDEVLELLQVHQPTMTRLPAAVSIPLLIQMVGRIYRAEPDPTPAKPARAKPRAKASPGTRTTKSPTRSRSSS
jgi:hypothetical protein